MSGQCACVRLPGILWKTQTGSRMGSSSSWEHILSAAPSQLRPWQVTSPLPASVSSWGECCMCGSDSPLRKDLLPLAAGSIISQQCPARDIAATVSCSPESWSPALFAPTHKSLTLQGCTWTWADKGSNYWEMQGGLLSVTGMAGEMWAEHCQAPCTLGRPSFLNPRTYANS